MVASCSEPNPVAFLISIALFSMSLEARKRITDTTCYNILARNGLLEAERRAMKKCGSFEWKHPDELVQSDLTTFSSVPLLTMEDDHSRRGWVGRIEDERETRPWRTGR